MKILKTIPYMDGNAVVFCSDKNYLDYAIVAIQSWLDNAKDPSCIFLLTDESNVQNMQEYMEANMRIPNGSSLYIYRTEELVDLEELQLYESGYITKAAYYRLLIPDFMPDYSRVLYLDCDICVVKSIEEAFTMPMADNEVIGGVEEFEFARMCSKNIIGSKNIPKELQRPLARKYGTLSAWYEQELGLQLIPSTKFMNSGVCLFNIQKCRSYGFVDRCLSLISSQMKKNGWIQYHDQDVINSICNGRIKWLPIEWNALWFFCTHYDQKIVMARKKLQKEAEAYMQAVEHSACIWHYITKKPWNKPQMNYSIASHWWKACSKTPFFEKYLARMSPTIQTNILKTLEEPIQANSIDAFF